MAMNPMKTPGLTNMLSGMFGLMNNPYGSASNQYQQYANQAGSYQIPFYNAGVNSLNPYQQNLQKMSDPQAYYNNIMSGYNASPYATIQQQQAMNSAQNQASASGLTGSTPLEMQMQQNAADISTADMDKYFKNIMGINTDYMSGLNNLITGGHESANTLTDIDKEMMRLMGASQFGQAAMKNKSESSLFSGLGELTGLFGF